MFHSLISNVIDFGFEGVPADGSHFAIGAGKVLEIADCVGKSDVFKLEHVFDDPTFRDQFCFISFNRFLLHIR